VCQSVPNFLSYVTAKYYLNRLTVRKVITKITSIAQLSQRDRAAAWVSYGRKWKTIFCRQYRSIFDHFDEIGLQCYRIWWNKAKWVLLRRSRSFKVTDVVTNRKIGCDFVLVINIATDILARRLLFWSYRRLLFKFWTLRFRAPYLPFCHNPRA